MYQWHCKFLIKKDSQNSDNIETNDQSKVSLDNRDLIREIIESCEKSINHKLAPYIHNGSSIYIFKESHKKQLVFMEHKKYTLLLQKTENKISTRMITPIKSKL